MMWKPQAISSFVTLIILVFLVLFEYKGKLETDNRLWIRKGISSLPSAINDTDTAVDPSDCRVRQCGPGQVCFNGLEKYSCQEQSTVVRLVVIVDENVHEGLFTMLYSIAKHTKANVMITVVVANNYNAYAEITQAINCVTLPLNIMVNVTAFDLPSSVADMMVIHSKNIYLKSAANFARFYLDRILQSVDYALYLDVDTIVKGDLGKLWPEVYLMKELLAATECRNLQRNKIFHNIAEPYLRRYSKEISENFVLFNAGVMGLNLKKWRDNDLTKEALFWMAENKRTNLWQLGTQPILNILADNDLKVISDVWNYRRIGGPKQFTYFRKALIYHFNGNCKPWNTMKCRYKKVEWRTLWRYFYLSMKKQWFKCIFMSNFVP